MQKRRMARGRGLALAIVVAGGAVSIAAAADPVLLAPSVVATIYETGRAPNATCEIAQAMHPGTGRLLVQIQIPQDKVLRSLHLRTDAGDLPLDVANSLPLVGEYQTIIDKARTSCATEGALVVEVESDLDTETAICPRIVLPKNDDCSP